jgi:hypothetical protein
VSAPRWVIPAAAVVVLAVTATVIYQHHANRPVPPALRDSIAVLKASKRADSVAHAQQIAAAETVYVQSQAQSDSGAVLAELARAHQRAAAAEAAAARASETARDSALHWRLAYEDEQRRGDSLDAALVLERRASESARASALRYQRADSISSGRLARVEQLNTDLEAQLERASGGCHLLPFVRCPTRTEVAVGSAVLTYVAVRRFTPR